MRNIPPRISAIVTSTDPEVGTSVVVGGMAPLGEADADAVGDAETDAVGVGEGDGMVKGFSLPYGTGLGLIWAWASNVLEPPPPVPSASELLT